tara:strand:- start:3763 stop:4053 length:291 start_codon:yes stop_codon:yes gene_type:complete
MCYSPKYNGNEETGGGSSSPDNYGSGTGSQNNEITTTTLPSLYQRKYDGSSSLDEMSKKMKVDLMPSSGIGSDAAGSSGKRKGLKKFSLLYNSLIK